MVKNVKFRQLVSRFAPFLPLLKIMTQILGKRTWSSMSNESYNITWNTIEEIIWRKKTKTYQIPERKSKKWPRLKVRIWGGRSFGYLCTRAQFHGSAYRRILRLQSRFLAYAQAPNFCTSLVRVEYLVKWSTHAQKPKFTANPWNTLAVSTEFPASVSADSVLTVSRAMKLGPGWTRLSVAAWTDLITLRPGCRREEGYVIATNNRITIR